MLGIIVLEYLAENPDVMSEIYKRFLDRVGDK
jgi:hypothetical protein